MYLASLSVVLPTGHQTPWFKNFLFRRTFTFRKPSSQNPFLCCKLCCMHKTDSQIAL